MLKRITSVLTAVILATGISVVAAPSANAFASNPGSSTGMTNLTVTPDANGDFFVPTGVDSVNIFLNFTIASGSLSGFNSTLLTFETQVKNPSNSIITLSNPASVGGYYDSTARYSATTASSTNSGTVNTSGVTLSNNLTSLSVNVSTYVGAGPGGFVPSGTYNFVGGIKKGGVSYSPVTNESSLSVYMPIDGRSFTIPTGTISRVEHNVVTCVNRSLVSASDTLTMNLVTTGSLTTDQTRFLSIATNTTSLGSTTTLSLSGVDLTQPIAAAVLLTVGDTTVGASFTSDLSITKGDGTEVSAICGASTPAAPTVVFTTTTRLTATFTVSSNNGYGQCQLFLASDLATVVRTSYSSGPGANTTRTCSFSSLTQGTAYVVKVSESGFFNFFAGSFSVNRELNSAFSSASQSITSGTPTPTLTAEQIAAAAAAATLAAAIEAERVRQAAIEAAKVVLQGLLKGDKPGTIAQYREADFVVSSEAALARINAALLTLSADLRVKNEEIAKVVKVENLVDQISTTATQKNVTVTQLISTGFLAKENNNKSILTYLLKNREASTLGTKESIAAVIAEETEAIKARAARLIAIKAKIAARNK
jgi:hypothetical protein